MTVPANTEITAMSECDARCPQRALVRVAKGALRLELCAHHYSDHEVALTVQGWHVEERQWAD